MDALTQLFNKRFILFFIAVLLLAALCYDGLWLMVQWWERDEYSHGYMIPLVAAYLVWQKRKILITEMKPGSLLGAGILFLAIFCWFLGELSSLYIVIQYAFWLGLWGLALIWVGVSGVRLIWAGIFYLVFMIPLPGFLYNTLSQELQLISSAVGVAVIRLFDISVHLEGNVIDLGVYKLQVVEACSGLRYLFPLMSFGFLISYIYRGPLWQKVVIFFSTIPITVLMNSFRIGVIGVTVEHFGIAAAEGFLHDFEGWFVFMACLGVLMAEIWVFYLFSRGGRPFKDLFDLDFGAADTIESADPAAVTIDRVPATIWASLLILIVALPTAGYLSNRVDQVPDRTTFIEYPLQHNDWLGRESALETNVLNTLKLTDYFIGNYTQKSSAFPVNVYTAWYEEQRKGASIHSPKSCLPGGGWVIQSHTIAALDDVDASGQPLNVNRVVMQMGEHKQLVYYWFQGRGRNITNEYMAKWYIFWDSLTRNRTDGALVRLITYVPEGSDISDADQRLVDYLSAFYPLFPEYIPD